MLDWKLRWRLTRPRITFSEGVLEWQALGVGVPHGPTTFVTMFNWQNKYVLSLRLAKSREKHWFSILDSHNDAIEIDITLGLDLLGTNGNHVWKLPRSFV